MVAGKAFRIGQVSADQVDLAVSQLEEWGWLKRFTRDTGGRPSPCVRINPALPVDK